MAGGRHPENGLILATDCPINTIFGMLRILALRSVMAVKISNFFKNPRWRTATITKMEQQSYLRKAVNFVTQYL